MTRGTTRQPSSNEIFTSINTDIVPESKDNSIQLGLCCLNITLREYKPSIYASRKMIQRTIKERGIDELKKRIRLNLNDILRMMEWNDKNGIKVFRLSSELFPHKTNPNVENYSYDFAIDLLQEIGKLSKRLRQRLTFHPGQYNVVGSPNEDAFKHTYNDLSYHADVLDLMGLDNNSVIVVHGGGHYGDKEKTKQRWCDNYLKLPQNVRNRLVLENCERSFSIKDCLDISQKIHIPVVLDTHHYTCYNILHPNDQIEGIENYIPIILKTWSNRNIKPKFHVSEQGSGRCGHHSDYIETIPNYLLDIPEKYGVDIDIMIEAKKKELAIFKLYSKYPQLNCFQINST
jgi:UV DNA damage endonuclease